MSSYFSEKYKNLVPYVPGEQPQDRKYIKLNTNESPFPPCSEVVKAAKKAAENLQLYSDPALAKLVNEIVKIYPLEKDEILFTNGSDEALNYAFMSFSDSTHPVVFPNITYGFYKVFAEVNNIPYEEIPLKEDFTIDVNDYVGIHKNIFIANPNAPTGLILSLEDIEKIVASNPENVVVIDEAYIDFGGVSALPLIRKYRNLLVCQTFSKSRSLAGGRLGFIMGNRELIRDMNTLKFSTNPYNVNSMTMEAGIVALQNNSYYMDNVQTIIENRDFLVEKLKQLDFSVIQSKTNFVFAKASWIKGEELYLKLKKNGILVRHFSQKEIADYNRITIGTREQMEIFITTIEKIKEEA